MISPIISPRFVYSERKLVSGSSLEFWFTGRLGTTAAGAKTAGRKRTRQALFINDINRVDRENPLAWFFCLNKLVGRRSIYCFHSLA